MEPFQIKGSFPLRMRFRPQMAAIQRHQALLEHQITQQVLSEIARYTAQAVARRIPPGGSKERNQNFAAYRALWASWGAAPKTGAGSIWLGNVAQMNQATGFPMLSKKKGGAWRYGAWFNLEWGREWPAQGEGWTYQENPGSATSPRDARPPGAGPADIEMTRWLRQRPKKDGSGMAWIGSRQTKQQKYDRALTNYNLMREWASQTMEGRRRGKPNFKARQLVGRFGQAPIRLGYLEGMKFAEQELPELMRLALLRIGKTKG